MVNCVSLSLENSPRSFLSVLSLSAVFRFLRSRHFIVETCLCFASVAYTLPKINGFFLLLEYFLPRLFFSNLILLIFEGFFYFFA